MDLSAPLNAKGPPAALRDLPASATGRIRLLMADGLVRSREDVYRALDDLELPTISKCLHHLHVRGELVQSGHDDSGRTLYQAIKADAAPTKPVSVPGTITERRSPTVMAPPQRAAEAVPTKAPTDRLPADTVGLVGAAYDRIVRALLVAVIDGTGNHPLMVSLAHAAAQLDKALEAMREAQRGAE